jgi:transcriptional regulator with XRE-family HTH domain
MCSLEDVFPAMGAGDALRGARVKENMTQAVLAAAIGVRREFVSQMEHGRRDIGKETARRLAEALGVDYQVFLSGASGVSVKRPSIPS